MGPAAGRISVNSHILVLNYNGRTLLQECLPSVVAAAREVPGCRVSLVDNSSTDGSRDWLSTVWPEVGIFRRPNQGLVSFNDVVAEIPEPAVFLLNNDVKLSPGFVPPMLEALRELDCFGAAPLCWGFDGQTYEGMLTRVRFRKGLVQATSRFPGYRRWIHRPGCTASAGAVLAVDREKFLALGGFDPLYLPGRLEDLDLCYRAWLAGWKVRYVPSAVAYHKGFGSFGPAFGEAGCDRLALRNTLLFVWKNIRDVRYVAAHAATIPLRFVHSILTAVWTPRPRRLLFCRALCEAVARLPLAIRHRPGKATGWPRAARHRGIISAGGAKRRSAERAFFECFAWHGASSPP